MTGYRQCVLKNGSLTQTSWIPERFAVVGKQLRLRGEDNVWTGMWTVVSTHGYLSEKQLKRLDRFNKRLRGRRAESELLRPRRRDDADDTCVGE